MNAYTGISAKPPSFQTPATGAPQPFSGATQQHFNDVYNQQAQQSSVDLGRAQSKMAADLYGTAQRAQTESALAGLGLLNTQQQNAWQRQNAQQQMAYGWMNDLMGGVSGMLGGLL